MLAILYGSETGDAHDYAETLRSTLQRHHYPVLFSTLNDFPMKSLLSIKVLIIVCSTTGQGEFPHNARKWWKFMLKKKLPSDLLNHLYMTTFGLGDSSYPQFNHAIKKIHRRLLQLGSVELSKRAEADAQSAMGIDGFYSVWEKELLKSMTKLFPLPKGTSPISITELLPPRVKVAVGQDASEIDTSDIKAVALERHEEGLVRGKITTNERITTADHFQDIRHFSFTTESDIVYAPGDTVSLYPSNSPVDVDEFLTLQNWTHVADKPLSIDGEFNPDGGVITHLTLRSLLTHHLDLRAIPRRSFFGLLKHFASDEREKDKLADFASYADPEELYDYANRPRRSILEVIQEFSSVVIPITYIIDLLPTIHRRLFSISSSLATQEHAMLRSVDLTVAIVEYRTMIRRIRKGLCTSWLKTLNVGDDIFFKVNCEGLKFGDRPVLMVAPGTGIAPMRSLVKNLVSVGWNSQQLVLFHGCRFKEKDWLYREEWEQLERDGRLTFFGAFSREGGGYVQDQLYLQADLVAQLVVDQGALVYVCGSSGKMPTQVRVTLETIFKEKKGWNEEEACKYLLRMESEGRYLQETW